MQLADKIRIIRKARGLSQEGLGFSLSRVSKDGVSRQAVSDWENGKSEPCLENIRDLAEVLGVSFDALLDDSIDLDDPQVLNAVLNKEKTIVKDSTIDSSKITEKSIGCDIEINSIRAKKFKMTIMATAFWVLALALIPLILIDLVLIFLPISFAFGFLYAIIIALIREIIPAAKGKMTKKIGHISYHDLAGSNSFWGDLTVNDKYIKFEDYKDNGNMICVAVEKIICIELGSNQKKHHGDIIVKISGHEPPMTIIDVMRPDIIVETFNRIANAIKENKEL